MDHDKLKLPDVIIHTKKCKKVQLKSQQRNYNKILKSIQLTQKAARKKEQKNKKYEIQIENTR